MAKTKESPSKGAGNPSKNLQKVSKAKHRDVNARMIIESLNQSGPSKDGKPGHSLAKIRNYIKNVYGLVMHGSTQEWIKAIMTREYNAGRIEMTNSTGKLNFTKRFQANIDNDEIEDDADDGTISMTRSLTDEE